MVTPSCITDVMGWGCNCPTLFFPYGDKPDQRANCTCQPSEQRSHHFRLQFPELPSLFLLISDRRFKIGERFFGQLSSSRIHRRFPQVAYPVVPGTSTYSGCPVSEV